MSSLVHQSYMSVSLSPKNGIQSSLMKENYSRKPIFKRNDDKLNSRVSVRDSMIICEHQGDQTLDPQQQAQQRSNILQPRRYAEYRSIAHESQKKNGVLLESSDQSEKLQYRKPFEQSPLINYPAIKMTNYSRIFGTQKKSPLKNQLRYFSVQRNSKSKQLIDLDRCQIENQLLKDQQFLLTQVVLSNQRKLRQLQQLQNLQTLNVDYKRKLYDAKLTVQSWYSSSPNNPILKQLLNVLTF